MHRLSVPTLLLVLALAAVAGPASAADGDRLLAQSLAHDGMAVQQGDLAMLFAFDLGSTFPVPMPATPWVSGSAASLRTVEYTLTWEQVDAPAPAPLQGGIPSITSAQEKADPVETTFTAATFRLDGHQPGFEAHAFALDGSIPFQAAGDDRELEKADHASMWRRNLEQQAPATADAYDLASYEFVQVDRAGPLVMQRGDDPTHTEVVLRGSFVFEMYGLTLDIQADDGAKQVASGMAMTPMAEGQASANHVRSTLVRMFLEDAELTLALDGGVPRMEWASQAVDLEPSGPVTFYNTRGSVGDAVLQDERFVLGAGSVLGIAPQTDGMAVVIQDSDVGPRGGTIADVPAPASAALVGSGAVLALLVAIGIGLLRRVLRQPQLAEVERAIEDGEYRRAARLAGRILARRPDDESAVLARGIALSKAGDQRRTVAELSDHLAQRPASDGSLHYVLGLAQLDLGQRDAGRASLREAVRLTPSLHAEVGSRLGKAFSSPAPTTKETSGYA